MNFIVINEKKMGKMVVNIENIVSFAYYPDSNLTRIDTVLQGYPLWTDDDVAKDLIRVIQAKGGTVASLK